MSSTMDTKILEGKRCVKDKANKSCLVEEEIDNYIEEEEEGSGGSANDEKKKKVFGRRVSGGGVSPPSCQVEKCCADLTDSKRYHRRHKVCEVHAKAPTVIVAGLKQRFCQQCSRFHELSEFDEAKRSCRKRLAGHNERRRKSSTEICGEGSSRNGVLDPQYGQADERDGIHIMFPGNSSFKRSQIR